MADNGGNWERYDVVYDDTLPFRRLIWAVEVQQHYVLHFEQGGMAYSTHFLVISPADSKGRRTLEWAAISFKQARDLEGFLDSAKAGKLRFDP